jgi:ABC-type dipeptide/oligopeptide/nickel transport system permease component
MKVLMDDSVVLIVYAVMLAIIIALFVGAYYLYKRNSTPSKAPSEKDKLTSNRGEPET